MKLKRCLSLFCATALLTSIISIMPANAAGVETTFTATGTATEIQTAYPDDFTTANKTLTVAAMNALLNKTDQSNFSAPSFKYNTLLEGDYSITWSEIKSDNGYNITRKPLFIFNEDSNGNYYVFDCGYSSKPVLWEYNASTDTMTPLHTFDEFATTGTAITTHTHTITIKQTVQADGSIKLDVDYAYYNASTTTQATGTYTIANPVSTGGHTRLIRLGNFKLLLNGFSATYLAPPTAITKTFTATGGHTAMAADTVNFTNASTSNTAILKYNTLLEGDYQIKWTGLDFNANKPGVRFNEDGAGNYYEIELVNGANPVLYRYVASSDTKTEVQTLAVGNCTYYDNHVTVKQTENNGQITLDITLATGTKAGTTVTVTEASPLSTRGYTSAFRGNKYLGLVVDSFEAAYTVVPNSAFAKDLVYSVSGNDIAYSFNIGSNDGTVENVWVVVAAYDAQGRMLGADGDTYTATTTLTEKSGTVTGAAGAATVKAFVLDGWTSLKPYHVSINGTAN